MSKELEELYGIKSVIKLFSSELYEEFFNGLNIIEKSLKDFEELKKGIAWREKEYKKELDSGVDCDGVPLSETNRKITLNLYNIMGALESYYKEKN